MISEPEPQYGLCGVILDTGREELTSDKHIDELSDPCALVESVKPHLAVFQDMQNHLEGAPYYVNKAFTAELRAEAVP